MTSDKIRVLDILRQTTADGPGLRTSIYCAGCLHHCKGCHNPQSWPMDAGKEMSIDEIMDIIREDSLANVSFSGGDPFFQAPAFTELARRIKAETGKTIWCWTGFTIEKIREDATMRPLLDYIDVLVDGPFILEQRDTHLKFRGSPNQRIIYLHGAPDEPAPGTLI